MNLAHLHLLLNHFPTIGTLVAMGLFGVSLFGKHDVLKRASLVIFFVIALISIPTYMTGSAADEEIKGRPDVSADLVASHLDAALPAFIFIELTGIIAWIGLWQFRRRSQPARWTLPAVLILSVVTFVLMARAANFGGEIRHPEILSQAATATSAGVSWTAAVANYVTMTPWVWPAGETLHFIGLCLLLGVVLAVNLRVLGIVKNVSFASLHRLLPVGIIGFVINSFTGMLFFIATPEQYTHNVAFYWKLVLMLLAGVNVLYFTVFDEPWELKAGDDAPLTAKAIAAATILLWGGVMYFGRMLPYLGNSF